MKGGYKGYVVQRDDPRARPPVTYVATVTTNSEASMSDSKKRTRKRTKKDQALSLAHEEGQGIACEDGFAGHEHDELCRPGVAKAGYLGNVALSNAVPVAGNPVNVPDYNARRADGGPGVATYHRDLQMHSTDLSGILASLRTVRGENNVNGPMDDCLAPGGFSEVGRVTLHDGDFASQSGSYRGLAHHPLGAPLRPDYHTAPIGAGNGSHDYGSRAGAVSRSPMSAKQSSLDIMKTYQRRLV